VKWNQSRHRPQDTVEAASALCALSHVVSCNETHDDTFTESQKNFIFRGGGAGRGERHNSYLIGDEKKEDSE